MARHAKWYLGLILATALAAIAPAAAQGPFEHQGPFTQTRSGAIFPEEMAGFSRVNLIQYDATGADVGATYQHKAAGGVIALTAYVYPAPPVPAGQRQSACATEFAEAASWIPRRFEGARALGQDVATRTHDVPAELSHRARFAIPTDQDGAPTPSTSELRLYCFAGGGGWQVKYRVTAPEGVDTSVVQAFIDAGPWPAPKRA